MDHVDLLVTPRWVVPVNPESGALCGMTVAVTAGRIVAIEPTTDAFDKFNAAECVELTQPR